MAAKNMKEYLTSLVIKEMDIRSMWRYQETPSRMAVKRMTIARVGGDVE